MKLRQNILQELIKESINSVFLNEGHVNTIFNLNTAIKLIEQDWKSPDDFWYVKIEQRRKDFIKYNKSRGLDYGDKGFRPWKQVNSQDSTGRENHIGYMIVRGRTKDEAIKSLLKGTVHLNPYFAKKYFGKQYGGSNIVVNRGYIEGLIDVCNTFFARAYMCINPRSMKETIRASRRDKKRGYGSIQGREFQQRAMQTKYGVDRYGIDWSKKRPRALTDTDLPDDNQKADVRKFFQQNNIPIDMEDNSHDGVHFITDYDKVKNVDFSRFDNPPYRNASNAGGRRNSDPMVGVHPDGAMILYSPCGV